MSPSIDPAKILACLSKDIQPFFANSEDTDMAQSFNEILALFHSEVLKIGRAFRKPVLGGKQINLWLLFRKVVLNGGYVQICRYGGNVWFKIAKEIGLPEGYQNLPFQIRKQYKLFLKEFEDHFCNLRLIPELEKGMKYFYVVNSLRADGEEEPV